MVKGQVLDVVVGGVDMGVRVLESRLDDKGRGVAGLGGGGVVGAGVAALGLDPGDGAVLQRLAYASPTWTGALGILPPQ